MESYYPILFCFLLYMLCLLFAQVFCAWTVYYDVLGHRQSPVDARFWAFLCFLTPLFASILISLMGVLVPSLLLLGMMYPLFSNGGWLLYLWRRRHFQVAMTCSACGELAVWRKPCPHCGTVCQGKVLRAGPYSRKVIVGLCGSVLFVLLAIILFMVLILMMRNQPPLD